MADDRLKNFVLSLADTDYTLSEQVRLVVLAALEGSNDLAEVLGDDATSPELVESLRAVEEEGAEPVGAQPCQSTSAGCYYDSLNVAVIEPAEHGLTVGSDPTEAQYVNSGSPAMYCGKTDELNTFAEVNCPAFYEGDQPAFKVEASG